MIHQNKVTILSLSLAVLFAGTSLVKANSLEKGNLIASAGAETKVAAVHQVKHTELKRATYKLINVSQSTDKAAVVYIGSHQIVEYTKSAGGYTPEMRAKILAYKINEIIKSGKSPKDICPGLEGGIPVSRIKEKVIFTADSNMAKDLNITRNQLAIRVTNNIRVALGAPKISRDFGRTASRSAFSLSYARRKSLDKEFGLASWYGGSFDGQTAANGTIYRKSEYTAAHKTLPLGSFVKVTNLNNKKSCIVQITDRGPFVRGRVIDLSTSAAKHLHMLNSGVSKVSIEVIDRF